MVDWSRAIGAEHAMSVSRLSETPEVIRAPWSGDTVDFDGGHHRITAAQQQPTPLHGFFDFAEPFGLVAFGCQVIEEL